MYPRILATRILGNKGLNTDKKLLPVRPKTTLGRRGEKGKWEALCLTGNRKNMAIAKLFALHANAIITKVIS